MSNPQIKPNNSPVNSNIVNRIVYLFCTAFFVTFVVSNIIFAVDVPFYDQFNFIDYACKFKKGELSFVSLFDFHAEHRLFIPRLVMLVIVNFSDWNIKFEIYINILCGILILGLYKKYFYDKFQANLYVKKIYTLICLLLLLSFMQYQNWMNGWQIQIFFNIILTILIYAAYTSIHNDTKRIIICVFLFILASLNFANGLFSLFPVLLNELIKSFKTKKITVELIVYSAVFILVSTSYLNGYTNSSSTIRTFPWNEPLLFFRSLCFALGSPLFAQYSGIAFVVGLIGLVSFVYFLMKDILDSMTKNVVFLMGMYSFFSLLMIVVGRSALGDGYSMHSRYATIVNFVWIYIFSRTCFVTNRKLIYASFSLVFIMLIYSNIKCFNESKELYSQKEEAKEDILRNFCSNPEKLKLIWEADQATFCELLKKLKDNKLSLFRDK